MKYKKEKVRNKMKKDREEKRRGNMTNGDGGGQTGRR